MDTTKRTATKWRWEIPDHPKEFDGEGMLALRAKDWQTCRDASETLMACVRRCRTYSTTGDQPVPDLLPGQL